VNPQTEMPAPHSQSGVALRFPPQSKTPLPIFRSVFICENLRLIIVRGYDLCHAFSLTEKPFATQQADNQHEINWHVPEIFCYSL